MNYGIIENPILDIWKFSDVSVLYLIIEITLVNSNAKSDEGIFLGYSSNSKAYRVFNKRTVVFDDIIFGSTNENLCKKFSKTMQDEFEMSMMGELKFFSWISNQANRRRDILKSIQVCHRLIKKIWIRKC